MLVGIVSVGIAPVGIGTCTPKGKYLGIYVKGIYPGIYLWGYLPFYQQGYYPFWCEFSQNFVKFHRFASRENVKTFK